jgi:serine/threonine-protein kinase ATR
MARKGGNSTQRMAPPPITNGHSIPPPSTIAAQIVHNASNLHDAQQDATAKVSFGELVKEFLQHPNTDEPDQQLVALISVIAEAGLEGLFKNGKCSWYNVTVPLLTACR